MGWGTGSLSQSWAYKEVGGGGARNPGPQPRGGEGQPLPARRERSSPDAPRGAPSREQEPEAEQRPGPRAAHAAPGALRARPLAIAPSLACPLARRPRRQPPRTRGSRFPAQRREGGREAGAGRGRAFPASPGPSARPPAPCAAAANPEGAPGGRAPPPGSPPGAHLSLVPCAACPFWGRGASSEVPNHVLQTEAGPRSLTQPGPQTTKPGLMMPGAASPLDIFEGSSHQRRRSGPSMQQKLPKLCTPLCAWAPHLRFTFNLKTSVGEVGTVIPILERKRGRPRHL